MKLLYLQSSSQKRSLHVIRRAICIVSQFLCGMMTTSLVLECYEGLSIIRMLDYFERRRLHFQIVQVAVSVALF